MIKIEFSQTQMYSIESYQKMHITSAIKFRMKPKILSPNPPQTNDELDTKKSD